MINCIKSCQQKTVNSMLDKICIEEKCDKGSDAHAYTHWYNIYFSSLEECEFNLLEVGVRRGNSMRLWKRFFKFAKIYGVDISEECLNYNLLDAKIFIGDITNKDFAHEVIMEINGGVDVFIDDGSHLSNEQIETFEFIFPKINAGGMYIIEDLQSSYFQETVNRISAVDFIKEKIDDLNWHGTPTRECWKDGERQWKHRNDFYKLKKEIICKLNYMEKHIETIHFYPGICFIFKR